MDSFAFAELVSGRRRGPLATMLRSGLQIASWGYRGGVAWRNRRFDRGRREIHHAPIPVISVGNLTAGGTGKTPMVEWICRWLRAHDRRVAILSRGYGAERDGVNDEALQLEQLLPDVPHLQDPDRVRLAEIAYEELESEILVLDDGFQHRRLHRDLDLVLIDATNPFGFGHLLPRGLLREPKQSLARADLVILTRVDQVDPVELEKLRREVRRLAPSRPVVETSHHATRLLSTDGEMKPLGGSGEAGMRVVAFCGIGNPSSFRRTLEQVGYEVVDLKTYPDHHRFRREDLAELDRWSRGHTHAERVVCTHKDLVKIQRREIGGKPLSAVCVELRMRAGEVQLEQAMQSILER